MSSAFLYDFYLMVRMFIAAQQRSYIDHTQNKQTTYPCLHAGGSSAPRDIFDDCENCLEPTDSSETCMLAILVLSTNGKLGDQFRLCRHDFIRHDEIR